MLFYEWNINLIYRLAKQKGYDRWDSHECNVLTWLDDQKHVSLIPTWKVINHTINLRTVGRRLLWTISYQVNLLFYFTLQGMKRCAYECVLGAGCLSGELTPDPEHGYCMTAVGQEFSDPQTQKAMLVINQSSDLSIGVPLHTGVLQMVSSCVITVWDR